MIRKGEEQETNEDAESDDIDDRQTGGRTLKHLAAEQILRVPTVPINEKQ